MINTKQLQGETIVSTSFVFLFNNKKGRCISTSTYNNKVYLKQMRCVSFLVGCVTPGINEQMCGQLQEQFKAPEPVNSFRKDMK